MHAPMTDQAPSAPASRDPGPVRAGPALRRGLLAAALVCAAVGGGCARGVLTPALRPGPLPSGWRPVKLSGARQAYHHPQGGAISAGLSCDGQVDDVSLDVLTNHLLFDLEDVRERGRAPLTLDGRAALRTQLHARVDGVEVELDLVVLKKDGCVVDLQLVAAPSAAAARRPDFDRFVGGLALGKRGG